MHLKGLVTTGTELFISDTPQFLSIFRLPPAYAPANERVFPTVCSNNSGQEISQGRVDVKPDGLVVFGQDCAPNQTDCSADGEYVSLDAISFRPDG